MVRWFPTKFDVISHLLPKSGKIVDLGCGLGHLCRFMHAFRPNCYKVYGMDFSGFAVKTAMANDKLTVYNKASVYETPYTDKYFDGIVASEFIEHLSDVPAFLREIKRIGRQGATVVITTPERNPLIDELTSEEHVREYTPKELMDTMSVICLDGEIISQADKTLIYRGFLR